MSLTNSHQGYGLIAIILHWLIAIACVGLFFLGLWMVDLSYYDAWYQKSNRLHEGFGVLLFLCVLMRILWRLFNPSPQASSNHTSWEKCAAKLTHFSLDFLLIVICISGYLIVTAKGDPLILFGKIPLPASLTTITNQEDIAGKIHFYLAWLVILLAGLHALAAIKHQFIDKDQSLRRMIGF